MKPKSAKPAKSRMRFFTPELYRAFNSQDEDTADRANEAWEKAIRAYQRHLAAICERLPQPSRSILETNYHDWELIACDQSAEPHAFYRRDAGWSDPLVADVGIVSLSSGGVVNSLFYILWDHLRWCPEPQGEKAEHPVWLYDELDVAHELEPQFVQRILFSDMSVLEIPFTSVLRQSFPLQAQKSTTRTRNSA
jgi:hypothetical protein